MVGYKKLIKRLFPVGIGIFILYYFGVFTLLFETNYYFYEKQVNPQIAKLVKQWLNQSKPPTFVHDNFSYTYIFDGKKKCDTDGSVLKLVYIVKSATRHFERREGIRNTWGFERRFSDVEIRTVFMLGVDNDERVQHKINEESKTKGDIIQANFSDTYYNNTIKTMMSLKWAVNYCSNAKFYFFSDDDMYVSTKNVLRFVRDPLEYPGYLEVPIHWAIKEEKTVLDSVTDAHRRQVVDIELDDSNELYAGYQFNSSRPLRYMFSKWYVPLSEYPYDLWPPYITAGAYVLSNRALRKLYYASFYVPMFRFDDIYLSMLALAVNIVPLHNSEFYFYKKSYEPRDYKYVIAVHGYGNPGELRWVWNDQKSAGNA